VLIAENWYLDWRATVDGYPAQVLRGDHALLTVRSLPREAGRAELLLALLRAREGRIGLVALLVVLAGFIVPPVYERRRRSG